MLYHASAVPGIDVLQPHVSNHDQPLVYLSSRRENVLVYLSNAVEKHCRENGFAWNGPWYKWASYGFSREGRLVLEEYYPNATQETYKGVCGYIYHASETPFQEVMKDIPHAYISRQPVAVCGCECIPDAYDALLKAEAEGLLTIRRYVDMSDQTLAWLKKVIPREYDKAQQHPDYRCFLQSKFSFLIPG